MRSTPAQSRGSVLGTVVSLLVLGLLAVASPAAADHPGSNLGLARFADLANAADGVLVDGVVHHLADVELTFQRWESDYPQFVSRMTIGSTSSGFPLLGVIITDEAVAFDEADTPEGHKYRAYLDGGHHGNEYLGVELVMYYFEDILTKAAAGDEATLALLADTELHGVPIINVDGNAADTRKNARQVDPNRNYPFEWGGPGSGDTPADFTYRGPQPLSEAETAANAAYGEAIRPDLWITMHSGVAEFYWPWGWTFDKSPDDWMFSSIEAPFEEVTNGNIDAMVAAELYLAAGATDDFGYGALGIPTFTFEVHEDQFIPAYGEPITEMITDQLAGLHFMVTNAKHLGARLVPTVDGDRVVVTNIGWGNATGVMLEMAGEVVQLGDIPARGGTVVVALPSEPTVATVSYLPLYIDSAQPRAAVLSIAGGMPIPELSQETPTVGFAPLVSLALVGLALVALRRRGA